MGVSWLGGWVLKRTGPGSPQGTKALKRTGSVRAGY